MNAVLEQAQSYFGELRSLTLSTKPLIVPGLTVSSRNSDHVDGAGYQKASVGESDNLRERILSASISLMEKEGLAALSLCEVARRAGVSHQAPYHYFADREAILAALAERGFETLRSTMAEVHHPGVAPTEALERAAIAYVDFACEYPAHFRIMFRPELVALKDHPESANRSFVHVEEMVIDCMKAGFPASFGVEVMSTLFRALVHGLACLLLDGPLVMRVPGLIEDQEQAVALIARASRLMIEATIAQEVAKRGEAQPVRR